MGFYNDVILPKLLDRAMRLDDLAAYRRAMAVQTLSTADASGPDIISEASRP